MLRLDDFDGAWVIERRIEDRRRSRIGTLHGQADFRPQGTGLRYEETGLLRFPDQPDLTSRQVYLWLPDHATGVEIRFADGRPFHRFGLNQTMPEATHICTPDLYQVTYDFTDWPRWSTDWRVWGPQKDYCVKTEYRGAGAEPD